MCSCASEEDIWYSVSIRSMSKQPRKEEKMDNKVYEKFFKDVTSNINRRISKRVKDSNVLRSNLANPHFKTLNFSDIPKLSFATLFGRKFIGDEILSTPELGQPKQMFQINTMERLSQLFSDNSTLVKMLKCNDCLVICPWMKLKQDKTIIFGNNVEPMESDSNMTLLAEKGRLVIPICANKTSVKCFVPCGGLDEENDLPSWVDTFNIFDFGLDIPYSLLNGEPGLGKITLKKENVEIGHIVKGQEVKDGDLIKVRGDIYKLLGWSVDCFNPSLKCLRFTSKIKRNAFLSTYNVLVKPIVKGNFCWVDREFLENHQPVVLTFGKFENMHGQLDISYQNACFNSLGFLTHDVAV